MKKILLILCVACLGVSCQNEEEPEIKLKNNYTLFIKNATHGEILVESKQLTKPMFTLDADKVSELLYSSSEEIELLWFGKGTYNKQRKGVFVLQKDKTTTIELSNADK